MEIEPELVNSPSSQEVQVDGKSIDVQIYRLVGEPEWYLEAVDEFGNSTVWDGTFATGELAMAAVHETIKEEGIDALIGEPSD